MSKKNGPGQTGLEIEAAACGFHRIMVEGYPQPRWAITCSDCGDVSHHGWQVNTGPTLMIKNMRNAGWDVTRRGTAACPACQVKDREAHSMMKQQIGPDPKIARKIYAALDEHFDEVKRLYRSGWNDERVAREIDTSPEIVVRIRRDAYGELAEDPAVGALRDDIELVKMQFAEDLANLTTDVNQRLAELSARMADLPALKKAIC